MVTKATHRADGGGRVTHDMTIAREEIFGPAAPSSSSPRKKVMGQRLEYGLVRCLDREWPALRFTDQLRVDVYINMRGSRCRLPGAATPTSGVGKDGSMVGLEFTDLKMVVISTFLIIVSKAGSRTHFGREREQMETYKMWVGGEWVTPIRARLRTYNPARRWLRRSPWRSV